MSETKANICYTKLNTVYNQVLNTAATLECFLSLKKILLEIIVLFALDQLSIKF